MMTVMIVTHGLLFICDQKEECVLPLNSHFLCKIQGLSSFTTTGKPFIT